MRKWHKFFNEGPMIVASPEAMVQLGRDIGALMEAGESLGLSGDLGSGKTHFTQGLAQGLGSSQDVQSPTFSIVQEHRDGRLPFCHFDFYRLERPEELSQIGWEDFLDQGDILVVEWADLFPDVMPLGTDWLRIEHLPDPALRRVSLFPGEDEDAQAE